MLAVTPGAAAAVLVVALPAVNADHDHILRLAGYTGGEMASSPARRAAAPPGPPAFSDRAQAGLLLGAALLEVIGPAPASDTAQASHPERASSFLLLHPDGTADGNRQEKGARGALPGPAQAAHSAAPLAAGGHRPHVFALPRGGVPVAAGVACALGATLDALMVRKIGHPAAPELGLGAIAEDGHGGAAEPYFDEGMLAAVGLTAADLADVVARERAELARRVAVYGRRHLPGEGPGGIPGDPAAGAGSARPRSGSDSGGMAGRDLAGELVIVVDDGLATGVTARAALRAVRARGAARTVLAVPVAASAAAEALQKETDEVVTLVTPRRFHSVGEWYVDFGQLTDADVLTILSSGGTPAPA
jgi:putative phosphoribosyl transferase